MKTIQLVLMATIISTISVFGQTEVEKGNSSVNLNKNNFGIEVSSMVLQTLTVEYERKFLNNGAIYLAGGPTLMQESGQDVAGIKGEVQVRAYYYHPAKPNFIMGFYVAPFFRYQYLEQKDYGYSYDTYRYDTDDYERNLFRTSYGGFVIGTRSYIHNKLYFDGNVGCGLRYVIDHDPNKSLYMGPFDYGNMGIYPRLNIAVGFSF